MPTKEKLINKLLNSPKSFTVHDFTGLMGKCGAIELKAGRGSGIKYSAKGVIIAFDLPHPQKELYPYQTEMVKAFLKQIGEING